MLSYLGAMLIFFLCSFFSIVLGGASNDQKGKTLVVVGTDIKYSPINNPIFTIYEHEGRCFESLDQAPDQSSIGLYFVRPITEGEIEFQVVFGNSESMRYRDDFVLLHHVTSRKGHKCLVPFTYIFDYPMKGIRFRLEKHQSLRSLFVRFPRITKTAVIIKTFKVKVNGEYLNLAYPNDKKDYSFLKEYFSEQDNYCGKVHLEQYKLLSHLEKPPSRTWKPVL